MSSNPLGAEFYDEDGVSLSGSEPTVKRDPLSEESDQPYLTNPRPPKPIQQIEEFTSVSSVQGYEPDNRYVQPERTPRPTQTSPMAQSSSSEPLAPASTTVRVEAKPFKGASAKSAVVVTKTPPGQSKLSKARAAARRAAIALPSMSPVITLPEPKPSRNASAGNEAIDQTTLEASKASHDLGDQPAGGGIPEPVISEASKGRQKPPKPSTKPTAPSLGDPVAKVAELAATELTEISIDPDPIVRRVRGEGRTSSADKMRAQRGIRTTKVKR